MLPHPYCGSTILTLAVLTIWQDKLLIIDDVFDSGNSVKAVYPLSEGDP